MTCTLQPLYLFHVEWGNFPVMGISNTFVSTNSGITVDLDTTDTSPYLQLCATQTAGTVPVYYYTTDPGTGVADPSITVVQFYSTQATYNYNGAACLKANGGQPLGYAYPSASALGSNVALSPVYVLSNGSASEPDQILSPASSATLEDGNTYSQVSVIGYVPS